MNLANGSSKSDLGAIANAWTQLHGRTRLGVIKSAAQHDRMVKLLDMLIDQVGDDESHPMAGLLELVGLLVDRYEDESSELPDASPRDVLKFLMGEHGLRQSDLREELGTQGVVSEILNGKREINARQAKALANRFGVSAAVFL